MGTPLGHKRLIIAGIVVTLAVFVIDQMIPLGVAGGVPYVVPVLMGLAYPGRRYILVAAVTGSLLTVLGFYISPAGGESWQVLFNRLLALFAIWVTALVCLHSKRSVAAQERSDKKYQRIYNQMRSIVEGTASTGDEFFHSLVFHLASALGTRYALIGMLTERSPDKIRTLAIWAKDQYSPEIEYFVSGTPCENVIGRKLCFYSKDIQKKFPDDQLLVDMKAEGYAGVPLFDSKGDPLGVMAVLHDHPLEDEENTRSVLSVFAARAQAEVERLQAEEKLHSQEARLSGIMETSVDGIITIDRDGILESFNPAAERMFGYSSSETIGRNVKMLMPEPYPSEHDQYMQNYMETGNAKIIGIGREVVGLHKDGSTFPMDLGVSEMWIDGKRYFNGTARDITEHKVAERKLQEAHDHLEQRVEERTEELKKFVSRLEKENINRLKAEEKLDHYARELERSNQALQEFSAIASHDLQEPLRKVIAFGDQLRSDYADALEERGLDFLERMQKAALRMKSFIESLLEYSVVGSKPAKFLVTDLNLLVREVLSDLEMRIHRTQARIEVGALPTLEVDPLQMRQLFQNLLGNALKFHKPDEPPVISIQSRNGDDSTYKIILKDNGIGFDTQYLDKIFKPFERLHGRGQYEGSGMGLAICKKIVERHNGHLTAESAKGEGSTFILSLPEKKS